MPYKNPNHKKEYMKIYNKQYGLEHKKERTIYAITRHRELKKEMITLLGGKCLDCGGTFPNSVYDFHHINPKEKGFSLSKRASLTQKVREELKKCILLCSNCHKIRHSNDN